MGRRATVIEVPKRSPEEVVRELASAGNTRAFIANFLKVSEYHIDEGQFSAAYQLGREEAENFLLAKAHARALNDDYRGADGNLWNLLKMVYGYRETTGISVGDSNITLLLTPEPPKD